MNAVKTLGILFTKDCHINFRQVIGGEKKRESTTFWSDISQNLKSDKSREHKGVRELLSHIGPIPILIRQVIFSNK